jgi:PEP-CTERM motif
MRAHTVKTVIAALAVLVLSLACVPTAHADSVSFSLTSNNLGLGGSVGTVLISDTGTDQVTVTITMNAGFSLKLPGGDIAFNGPSGLTAGSASDVQGSANMFSFTGLSFQQFFTDKNISQFGNFSFDFANVKGAPNGVVSADTLTFVLSASGLTANQFTGAAIHFCTASGGGCGPQTGFASNGPLTPVPEPGTLSLLGTGLLGLAGFARRAIRR